MHDDLQVTSNVWRQSVRISSDAFNYKEMMRGEQRLQEQ
jgi:hypothetical protein